MADRRQPSGARRSPASRQPPASRPSGRAAAAKAPAARAPASGSPAPTKSARRHADKTPEQPAATRGRASEAASESGGLRSELLAPLGLGALVMVGVVGLLAVVGSKLGPTLLIVIIAAGVVMSGALVFWVGWILDGAVARPLLRVREALQLVEEGNYDTRLKPAGAAELCDVARGFNRMATIVEHQRERLKMLAYTDPLTGLANHRHFYERLRAEVHAAREHGGSLAVVALDIDNFRQLNDARGHSHGDEALRACGDALMRAVRDTDLVARLGGDEYMLLLPSADPGYAREVAERARQALKRALPDDPPLTASAGFVCFPEQVADEANLAELAVEALEVAKRAGGDETRKYDPDQVAAIPTVKQQRAEVDALLESEAPIIPVFQPLVELATGRLVGYEALSRFTGDFARAPDAWFNQAQRCGRGQQLESLAIRTALAAGGRPQGTYLSLNFSPSAISSTHMLNLLPKRLNDVVIEITEHELASADGSLEEGLARLRARGARIAVDDAGAGYAGLNQVMRVQPDLIKLDRSLVEAVHTAPAKAALIEFFVMFATRVGAAVCTEGIETIEELRALINLGVTYGQGYLLGRPAEPWSGISEEIFRALATGALLSHAQPVRQAPTPVAAHAGMQRKAPAVGAPVNRRLTRYRHN
jgi:diguanylate cyclase (GGDEF)-like protein